MIYIGAVGDDEDPTVWARPSTTLWQQLDVLTEKTSDDERRAWRAAAAKTKKSAEKLLIGWDLKMTQAFADTTREPLRDETLRKWHELGAVRKRAGRATSYPGAIWALEPHFAALFEPALVGSQLTDSIDLWIEQHMDAGSRLRAQQARQRQLRQHATVVTMPDGEVRRLEPGASSLVLKGVVEQWAPRRLAEPVVLSISEPGEKILVTDELLLASLGLTLDKNRILPDALIADTGTQPVEFWIIEAVASDGPVTDARKADLIAWAEQTSINPNTCRFLSAFESRGAAIAKRRLKDLAIGSYAWFADEPDLELSWDAIQEP